MDFPDLVDHGFSVTFDNSAEVTPSLWPKVTVIVTLYNYAEYIKDALESLLVQTFSNFGVVIVDDNSTDNSHNIALNWISKYEKKFERAVLLRQNINTGLSECRNRAFQYCKSPYIFVLDADNLLYPRCLQRCYETISVTSAAFCYPIIQRFGDEQDIFNFGDWDIERLARGNYIDAMCLIKREVWQQVGGYSDMRRLGKEDYDLWCKLAVIGESGVLVPEILGRYRVHGKSMTANTTSTKYAIDEVKKMLMARYPKIFTKDKAK